VAHSDPRSLLLEELRGPIEKWFEAAPPATSEVSVPLNAPTYGASEVLEALDSLLSTRVTMGSKVDRFEQEFARYIGTKHAVMVNSGSSANLLIMAALANPLAPAGLRLQPGDEVLVPAVTWSTTLWPVIQLGCIPVLVDADLATLNMSVAAAERAITPKTRAIFLAHILGNACDMQGFQALARKHDLILLEDSCEALGTTFQGLPTGRFSEAASYSFFFSHHITTIEGGMVVTNNDDLADLLRCLRAHGWTRHMHSRRALEAQHPEIDPRFLFVNIGYNLRPTELQAAFGLHQLPRLDGFNRRRKQLAAAFQAGLQGLKDDLQLIEATPGADHTWFGFPVLLRERHAARRQEFSQHLESHRIETRPIIAGNLAVQPALKLFPHRLGGSLPNAEAILHRGIYWGSHPHMTEAEVNHVVQTVTRFFRS
jgi:CDP-6-deoxy-D-xylo-4-hexulose-3-dehydrase